MLLDIDLYHELPDKFVNLFKTIFGNDMLGVIK